MFATQIPTAVAGVIAAYVAFSKQAHAAVFIVLILLYIVVTGLMAWLITWYYRKRGYEK